MIWYIKYNQDFIKRYNEYHTVDLFSLKDIDIIVKDERKAQEITRK